jgi:predicted nucleic acid-binding protein
MAMKQWAVGHANIVKVVSPDSLAEEIREEIRKEIRKAAELYGMKEKP